MTILVKYSDVVSDKVVALKKNGDKTKPVVLSAEDDEHISYLIEFLLERQGYHVVNAHDGYAFLDLLKDSKPPDIILLDIMLPYVDGYELIRQVRRLHGWKNIPIIALSALHRQEDIVQAFKVGANDYITKPFQPLELVARVERLLEKDNDITADTA